MRTLFDIIEAAKIGEPTTHEECLYALLAYSGLSNFDSSALCQLAFKPVVGQFGFKLTHYLKTGRLHSEE